MLSLAGLPAPLRDDNMPRMKLPVLLCVIALTARLGSTASAQTPAPGSGDTSDLKLETLIKKVDEQNTKIDALSQHILNLEQQISTIRPGVLIGEATPAATPAAPSSAIVPDVGNAHVVTKGETLTSIAKAHKVGVQDLQKFNHIENDRALQIGQTMMIPTSGAASPAASATASPNE